MDVLGFPQTWWTIVGLALDLIGVLLVVGEWLANRRRQAASEFLSRIGLKELFDLAENIARELAPIIRAETGSGYEGLSEQQRTDFAVEFLIKNLNRPDVLDLLDAMMGATSKNRELHKHVAAAGFNFVQLRQQLDRKLRDSEPMRALAIRKRFIFTGIALITTGFLMQIVGAWPIAPAGG